jgi:hypothetical protein
MDWIRQERGGEGISGDADDEAALRQAGECGGVGTVGSAVHTHCGERNMEQEVTIDSNLCDIDMISPRRFFEWHSMYELNQKGPNVRVKSFRDACIQECDKTLGWMMQVCF